MTSHKPTIYFLCADTNAHSGGIKVLYRHVDILNAHGFSACILHSKQGFRCSWFDNTTTVKSVHELELFINDYFVISEIYLPDLGDRLPHNKKVVFNQNCYYTFLKGYSYNQHDTKTPYHHQNVVGVLVVSDDSLEYMQHLFPNIPITKIRNATDTAFFSYQERKEKIISFMTRKHSEESIQVINILKLRNALEDFTLVPIENKKEHEVAQIMKESLIFLSFGYPEGFALPPAEAMACGCIVIGYHGRGGKEYFKTEFSYPIEQGDIITFSKTVEEVIQEWNKDPRILNEKRQKASEYILQNYSKKWQEKEVVGFWSNMFNKTPISC
ncbi:MAG: glycosyltransferase [Candidatus Omnitrophica bacterium]|nr:glycosyltransferase [Candidatus Omnitrophota bacterium]